MITFFRLLAENEKALALSAVASLWRLFRHKSWQKVLKASWNKLENGDYDWAHVTKAYWLERVREKCTTDMLLAIAHDLEGLFNQNGGTSTQSQTGEK